jgi:hypothetical protein
MANLSNHDVVIEGKSEKFNPVPSGYRAYGKIGVSARIAN